MFVTMIVDFVKSFWVLFKAYLGFLFKFLDAFITNERTLLKASMHANLKSLQFFIQITKWDGLIQKCHHQELAKL